jgi:transcriptional regulator with XRE-family HTH domain
MSADAPTPASVLRAWIDKNRQSYAHIARVAGVSRNTVTQIVNGKTHQSSAQTLCQIAVGIAVDPKSGQTDQEVIDKTIELLEPVAGLGDLRERGVRQPMRVLLATVVGSREVADDWLDLIADYPDIAPSQVRALLDRWRAQRRSLR